jgi:hypothetical protein
MKQSVNWIACLSGLLLSLPVCAQYASDIFRYSEINQTGSARFQSLGGNHAALGADPSTISGNPAGLGFYNRSEFSVSPAVTNINTKTSYIDQFTTGGKTNVNLAQASLVITSQPSFQRKWKRTSMGVSFSRQQSFHNAFNYRGTNNRSAYVDKVVEDADQVGWTDKQYDDEYFSNGNKYYYLDEAYFGLQMIYPTRTNPQTGISGPPYARDDADKPTRQDGIFDSKGAHTQWTFSYGGNFDDKLYVGGSVGFSGVRYSFTHSLQDTYVNGTVFRSSVLDEEFTVRSNGVNATFGLIYKFSPVVQLGGSLSTPTFARISRESINQYVSADYIKGSITNNQGQDVGPTDTNIDLVPNDFEYTMTGPFRGSAGATLFLGNSGFITGTIDYVGYAGMRGRTTYLQNSADNEAFSGGVKSDVKDLYKNVVNARVGGEYRSGIFRVRLGLAYLADPYLHQTDDIKRDKIMLSAGVGVRTDRFYADLTGTMSSFKSAYTPYVLNNPQDYSSASISNKVVNVMLTVGTFF